MKLAIQTRRLTCSPQDDGHKYCTWVPLLKTQKLPWCIFCFW